ncbi:hypothetical protein [Rhodospirillum sp. A1_3_36]|uniref:hypothetical protein n=1 Tax=Rhodospirillum sp. A1_3_36 TaxID=3391666 RepID=UPI0039A448D5
MTVTLLRLSQVPTLWMLAASLLLSGCGDLPRPFARDRYAAVANPLVALRSGTGVTVQPAVGLPVPWNRLLALEIAEMLRGQGIPAEAGESGTLGHRLSLRVGPALGSSGGAVPDGLDPGFLAPGALPMETTWQLTADDGTALAGDISYASVQAIAWERAAPESARALGAPVVAAVSTALGGGGWSPGSRGEATGMSDTEPPLPHAAPSSPGGAVTHENLAVPPIGGEAGNGAKSPPPVEVPQGRKAPPPPGADQRPPPPAPRPAKALSPDGKIVMAMEPRLTEAPGTGGRELEQAMATLIRAAGMAVTRNPEKASFAIIGTVTTTPVAGDQEKVDLVWRVTDPKSGDEIGTVRQQNVIPKGMLDGEWGRLAYEIAQAALEGVGDVLTGQTQ